MDSRPRRAWMAPLVAVLLGAALAWPAGASAVTVTVGRQDFSVPPDDNYGCSPTSCGTFGSQIASPTALSDPGDRAVVPRDGVITSWRVRGSFSPTAGFIELTVIRPRPDGRFFIASSSGEVSASHGGAVNGAPNPVSPGLAVAAGDLLGVLTVSNGGTAKVDALHVAAGASVNVFAGPLLGTSVFPSSTIPNVEPYFNADVVLDPPVVDGVSPGSGSTAGGQTVTISGEQLAGASQVSFGGLAAKSFSPVSNTEVTAVTPGSLAGTVHVTVKTPGGTSATSAADQFTFTAGGAGGGAGSGSVPPDKASFAGSRSAITVSRMRRFRFGFHAVPGLGGTAIFQSLKKVTVSRDRKVTLARKAFTVPASSKVTLKIKLSKKAFRILKRNRRIRTRITVTLKNGAGLTSTASKKITLKAPTSHR